MKRVAIAVLLFCLFFSFCVYGLCDADEERHDVPSIESYETLVRKLIDLRKEAAMEMLEWDEEKALLQQEYLLLEKEKVLLQKEFEVFEQTATSREKGRADLLTKKERYEELLDAFPPVLDKAEVALIQQSKKVPESLLKPFFRQFEKLKNTKELSIAQRLQLILGLYGELEQLNSEVHLVKELIKTDTGREREFDVIYIGLSRGYCISSDDKIAGVGRIGSSGVLWEWSPGAAASIRKGINVYKQTGVAEFVLLPVDIQEVR